jgi:hypothetical protein
LGAFLLRKNRAIRSNSSKIASRQFSAGFPLLSLAQGPTAHSRLPLTLLKPPSILTIIMNPARRPLASNQAIKQSSNQAIKQSSNQAIKQSSKILPHTPVYVNYLIA